MTSNGGETRSDDGPDFREPGSRRRRFAGYLKAANELRQTYQQSYKDSWTSRNEQADGANDMPGAFPGAITATSGHEQVVIFPSYARRHVKRKPSAVPGTIQESSGTGRDVRDTAGSGDAEFWRQEWDKYEDDNAVVDVDVRGWLYSPHRGPLSRRNRLMVGLARQLSGIPAPRKSPSGSATPSRSSSPSRLTDKLTAHASRHEDEQAAVEAQSIIRKGEAEARVAGQGGYSEDPSREQYDWSRENTPSHSRESSLSRARPLTRADGASIKPMTKQTSWNNPSELSQEELIEANAQMMMRLQPFLANPLAYVSISAFYYNETDSIQKSIETDAHGHFTFRSSLSFVPTHVKVLASEKLSVTEKVLVTEPHGVSVISDIDDTIKHSAISMGAREIFRNVFIRNISELSIRGVKEWYNALSDLGCTFHYVSNSPWQMYPLLTSFFSSAGLPQGSFHLKQYSGVFQGIFEPVAERKKSTLDKILMDFPDRRFLLVGDSGEADLEVYTDFVCENPGRILGVFIRDVTTTAKPGFFDSTSRSSGHHKAAASIPDTINEGRKLSVQRYTESPDQENEDFDLKEAIARSIADNHSSENGNGDTSDAKDKRPALPKRTATAPVKEENLIDFDVDDDQVEPEDTSKDDSSLQRDWLQPPPRPAKPRSLSGHSLGNEDASIDERTTSKSRPPLPRKPSTSIHTTNPTINTPGRIRRHLTGDDSARPKPPRPDPPAQRLSYRAAARSKLDSAYARLPSPTSLVFGPPGSRSHSRENSVETEGDLRRDVTLAEQHRHQGRPPVPPRKPTTYAGSAAQSIQNMYSSAVHSRSSDALSSGYGSDGAAADPEVPLSRKEEAWVRRWARASEILERKGVVLKSWRVGDDARGLAGALVESALAEDERRAGRRGARSGR